MSDENKKKMVLLIGSNPNAALVAALFEKVTNMPMVEAIDRRLEGESDTSILLDISKRIKEEVG